MTVTVLSPEESAAIAAQTVAISQLVESTNKLFNSQLAMLAGLQHFTIEQVADFFHCTTRTVQNWEKPGNHPQLLPTRIGGKVLYRGSDLLAFAEQLTDKKNASLTRQSINDSLPKAKRR